MLSGCADKRSASMQARVQCQSRLRSVWDAFGDQVADLRKKSTSHGLMPVPGKLVAEEAAHCPLGCGGPGLLAAPYVTESETYGRWVADYRDVEVLVCHEPECLHGVAANEAMFLLVDGRIITGHVDVNRYTKWVENLPADAPWQLPHWIEEARNYTKGNQ